MRQLKIAQKITARESEALDKYLNEISKLALIGPEEEVELARRIKMGDEKALEKLTQANLRFVVSVAKQYQNQGLSLSDLINEGNVGLIKAARRFDETKGFKFISYAVWWIRQCILQAIVENSRMVRIPMSKAGSYNKVNDKMMEFMQMYEREPTDEELAEALDLSPREVENLVRSGIRHVSLDAPVGNTADDNDATLLDLMVLENSTEPDRNLMSQSLRDEIAEGLTHLGVREREVISAFFGLNGQSPMSLDEIGEYFGLSRERARQLRDRAIARLRKSVAGSLQMYLG
jgi:RNA polymerase primary sigma factor